LVAIVVNRVKRLSALWKHPTNPAVTVGSITKTNIPVSTWQIDLSAGCGDPIIRSCKTPATGVFVQTTMLWWESAVHAFNLRIADGVYCMLDI